jgi:predicted DNA-binding transcriptional regulator AlpA
MGTEIDNEILARQIADLVLDGLFKRSRDEMTVDDVCREFGISRQTIRRRIKTGLLPKPVRKCGKFRFVRSTIVKADLDGLL